MDLDWYYVHRKVYLSILLYVKYALTRFRHGNSRNPQHQPYQHIKQNYVAKAQYVKAADVFPPLSIADNFSQEFTGTYLYYARTVDPTVLISLGSIASQQAKPTEQTMQKVKNS